MRERTIKKHVLLLFALLIVFAFCGCAEEIVDYPARIMPDGILKDKIELSRGEALFMDKCASCHGKPGEGRSDRATFFEPPAPDFTDAHYQRMDPAYLYWRIEVGKSIEPFHSQGSVMPAWGMHLTEQQLWQIVAYLQVRAH